MADDARLPCCVPFCRRTTARNFVEWICGEHWRLTNKNWRRKFFLFRRRRRHDLEARMWQRLKRQAIERAAGL
jgi:hypothetical protein